jgi:hypothetical protein
MTWLYWSCFNAHQKALSPSSHTSPQEEKPTVPDTLLREALTLLQYRVGSQFPPGRSANPRAPPFLLTLDAFKYATRPFGWYVLVKALKEVTRMKLWWQGAKFGTWGGIELVLLPSLSVRN